MHARPGWSGLLDPRLGTSAAIGQWPASGVPHTKRCSTIQTASCSADWISDEIACATVVSVARLLSLARAVVGPSLAHTLPTAIAMYCNRFARRPQRPESAATPGAAAGGSDVWMAVSRSRTVVRGSTRTGTNAPTPRPIMQLGPCERVSPTCRASVRFAPHYREPHRIRPSRRTGPRLRAARPATSDLRAMQQARASQ